MSKIKPIGKRILIKPAQSTNENVVGGIIVSVNAKQEAPQYGRVIEVGAGVTNFTAGDTIIFGRFSSVEISINGEKNYLVNEEDVLAILE